MRTSQPSRQKKRLLLCFSPKDAAGKAEFVAHLAPACGSLAIWSVDELAGGVSIPAAFHAAASSADVALLFLSSDFFVELDNQAFAEQIDQLRQQRDRRELLLIPLLWRPCDWQAVPWLAALRPLPKDGVAIALRDNAQRDLTFAGIARQLDGRSLHSAASDHVENALKRCVFGACTAQPLTTWKMP